MQYNFEWDPKKAATNLDKHKITFELAATVFKDPRALSLYDEGHNLDEDRWITLGLSEKGSLLKVHHTYRHTDEETVTIRIISSRKATKNETRQYTELP